MQSRRTVSRPWRPLFFAVVVLLFATLPAHAQQSPRAETVQNRARPGLDPIGVRFGTSTLYPTIGVELGHDDNVFATQNATRDDTVIRLSPEITLDSRSSRHRADAGLALDIARYSDFDSEDYEDLRLWADGEVAIGEGAVQAGLKLAELHEDRTSPDDVRGAELTEYSRTIFNLAYSYRPGRAFARVDLVLTDLDFDDTATAFGSIDNDDRDRDRTDFGLRAGYALTPDYAVYVESRIDEVDYDQAIDNDGFARGSDGFELRLGTLIDFTGRTAGEFFIGYLSRDYDEVLFGDVDGASFGGEVTWNVSGLTTLTLGGSRTVDATTIIGAAGVTKTRLELGVDHELLTNLILSAGLAIGSDDFENIDRDDDLTELSLGGSYLMNRYAKVLFGYRFRDRDSSPASSGGRIYEINEFFVRIVGQL